MARTLDIYSLPAHTLWDNARGLVQQRISTKFTTGGVARVARQRTNGGRSIVLQWQENNGFLRYKNPIAGELDVERLEKLLASSQSSFLFTWDNQQHNVIIDPGGVSITPWKNKINPNTDAHFVTLSLLTV